MLKTEAVGGMVRIVCDDLIAFDPNSGVGSWANTISGSFTYPAGDKPCSILINKGIDVCPSACHAWLGFPETVIYRTKDKVFHIGKYKYTSQIPDRQNVLWAVGGVGLMNLYNPAEEGFSKFIKDGKTYNYSDVVRVIDPPTHTMLGVKDNLIYLIITPKMSGPDVNKYAIACGFDYAIMLDGGHISAMNGSIPESKINLWTKQGYALQGIGVVETPTVIQYRYKVTSDHIYKEEDVKKVQDAIKAIGYASTVVTEKR